MPTISVILVTYNHQKYIQECIDSLLNQSLRPSEILICDDCSTDMTGTLINRYYKQYPDIIKLVIQKKNVGSVANSQAGRKLYQGDFVSVIEGDDRWLPDKLERELKALKKNPDADIAYSGVYLIDSTGKRIGKWIKDNNNFPNGEVFADVFSKNFFSNTRSVYRNELMSREVFDSEGYCDETLSSFWDWDMKCRMSYKYKVVYSGVHSVEYRRHITGYSIAEPRWKHLNSIIRIYEKYSSLLCHLKKYQEVYVRASLEFLIAKNQPDKMWKSHSFFSINNILNRNRLLLKELPESERLWVEKKLPVLADDFKGKRLRTYIYLIRHIKNLMPEKVNRAITIAALVFMKIFNKFKGVKQAD